MKAYKAFNKDLTCRGFQYEIGKTYEMKEKPIVCDRGFHACTKFDDVFNYYTWGKETRLCEVELLGDIVDDSARDSKVATNKIRIVRELTKKDLFNLGTDGAIVHLVLSGSRTVSREVIQKLSMESRYTIATFGSNYYRDMLVNDPHSSVRRAVAENGTNKHRDILINDEDDDVRCAVASRGTNKHRDILVHGRCSKVRERVACFGTNKHHDILVNDVDAEVRRDVAVWGTVRHRDILINDVESRVRAEVARCGNDKHRDILVTDSDGYVRWTVAMFGNDKHRVILSDDEDDEVREEACSKREIQYWYPFL